MSEHGGIPVSGGGAAGCELGQGAGMLLREAREAAGLDIAALASLLKVSVKKLEALESDNWELLHDSAFTRALAASVCRTLRLDPATVLDRLPALTHKLIPDGGGINAPFRSASGEGHGLSRFRHFSRPLVVSVAALFLGAMVLFFFPAFQSGEVPRGVPSAKTGVNLSPVVSPAEGGSGSVLASDSPVSSIPMVSPTATAAPVIETGAASSPSLGAPSRFAATESEPDLPSPPAGNLLIVKTSGTSWIEVSDARGAAVFRKLMQAGESAGISGVLPLAVLVGKSDVTHVEVRGKQLDLKTISRDNVARFEVK